MLAFAQWFILNMLIDFQANNILQVASIRPHTEKHVPTHTYTSVFHTRNHLVPLMNLKVYKIHILLSDTFISLEAYNSGFFVM